MNPSLVKIPIKISLGPENTYYYEYLWVTNSYLFSIFTRNIESERELELFIQSKTKIISPE